MNERDACPGLPCNIRRRARRLRRLAGILSLTAAALLGLALWEQGADRWWRFLLLPPLHFGFLGLFQSRQGVCAAYALLGVWECSSGTQKIPDPRIENEFKDRAKRMLLLSLALSSAILLAFLLL